MTANHQPYLVIEESLSIAWAKALLAAIEPRRKELAPLVVIVTGFEDSEVIQDESVCLQLAAALARTNRQSYETVANTIFPRSLWIPTVARQRLYDRYLHVLPRIRKHPANRYGVYFERMIAYGDDPKTAVNQLEHIIQSYQHENRRRSALQAAIFDPHQDHTNQRQRGFPCLDHVTFSRIGTNGLSVGGFYARQYLFEKAYGNYLGLCRLGRFVAHELDLELIQMNCTTAIATLNVSNRTIMPLIQTARARTTEYEDVRNPNTT